MPRKKYASDPVLPEATSVPVKDKRKARHTCWTLNNYTETDLEVIREYADTEPRYMCWSQEVGDEGTPHLQGYVAWDTPRSLEKFKNTIAPKRLHYEPYTNGTAQQNRMYCLGMVEKKGLTANPTFEEVGELPAQGTRTDWEAARKDLQDGTPIPVVIQHQPQLLPNIRALERFTQMSLRPLNRDVKVIVLIGVPGTGKTKWAYESYPDLYSKPDGQWFDGYTGQKTLLLDDYYGDLPYSTLLKVCDRYPLQVPIKGGFVYAQWDTIIITSNKPPSDWGYSDITAFNRRVTETREFTYPCRPAEEPARRVRLVVPPSGKPRQ